jgi:hypothetical protein
MRRLCAATLVLAVVAAFASRPTPAQASGLVKFRLTDTDSPGAPPVSTVLMSVVPPGSIAPPDPAVSPLTILSGSTGFNPSDLKVLLGDGTTPSGGKFQALKLDFGTGGLQPGGRLYFALNLSPAYSGLVSLVLPSSVTNLAIDSLPANFGNGGSTGSTGGNTPEPVSVVVWSSLAGLVVAGRAVVRRRARTAVAA